MTIPQRPFGNTGLAVSALGFGAGEIGAASIPDADAERLLNGLLDLGINLIDTARGYGLSEERIGRYLHTRRHEFVLSTKIGYGIPGYTDWTGAIITAGVEAALQRLQTNYIDIVHLHSCPVEVLQNSDVIPALLAAVQAGKIRLAAYSGDNQAFEWALNSGQFASLQTSINICDQWALDHGLEQVRSKGLGLIAKRPVANIPWQYAERPTGRYVELYWDRFQIMKLDPAPFTWPELALRFTTFLPGVSSSITGSTSLEHMRQNCALVEKGPLPAEKVGQIRAAFMAHGITWPQET